MKFIDIKEGKRRHAAMLAATPRPAYGGISPEEESWNVWAANNAAAMIDALDAAHLAAAPTDTPPE